MSSFKPNYFQKRSKPQGPKSNERIRALDVQVIGSDGGNLGAMPLKKAIELAKQEKILIDDGKILLKVIETNKKNKIQTEVIQGGELYSKKG